MQTTRKQDVQAFLLELRRDVLSTIPTHYGRLVFLSGLRDPNSGRYEHFDALSFAEDELCTRVLEMAHIETYREWVSMSLEQQRADLGLYLVSVGLNARQVLRTWLVTAPYRSLIPLHTQPVEQDMFLSDMQALLALLINEHGIDGPAGAA
jgi:hypothetical protein